LLEIDPWRFGSKGVDLQQEMTYGKSNGHVTDDVM